MSIFCNRRVPSLSTHVAQPFAIQVVPFYTIFFYLLYYQRVWWPKPSKKSSEVCPFMNFFKLKTAKDTPLATHTFA